MSTSHNLSHSQNVGYGESESMNVGNSASYGQSSSNSFSQNLGESFRTMVSAKIMVYQALMEQIVAVPQILAEVEQFLLLVE